VGFCRELWPRAIQTSTLSSVAQSEITGFECAVLSRVNETLMSSVVVQDQNGTRSAACSLLAAAQGAQVGVQELAEVTSVRRSVEDGFMTSANDEACDTNKLFTISQQRRMAVRDRPDSVGIALKCSVRDDRICNSYKDTSESSSRCSTKLGFGVDVKC